MWTSKYAPKTMKDFIGNASGIKKINDWLRGFIPTQSPKLLLLIGPPGIGKTSAVCLIGKAQNYTIHEFNASDTRSPAQINELIFNNYTLDKYFTTGTLNKRNLVLMDEIDGMQPTAVSELVKLAETSTSPIICICNVETTAVQKLAKHVDKIRFYDVSAADIRRRLMSILQRERSSLSETTITDIIAACGSDIRSAINQLEWTCLQKSDTNTNKKRGIDETQIHSDTIFNMVKTLMNSDITIDEALAYYFEESLFVPLFVAENYLGVCADIDTAATVSESVSRGDQVSSNIYENQQFELMPLHGFLTTVAPVKHLQGHIEHLTFPSVLGKTSSLNSRTEKITSIADTTFRQTGSISHNVLVVMERLRYLVLMIIDLVKRNDLDGVVKLLKTHGIMNGDGVKDLFTITDNEITFKTIDKKAKTRLTKALKL